MGWRFPAMIMCPWDDAIVRPSRIVAISAAVIATNIQGHPLPADGECVEFDLVSPIEGKAVQRVKF